MHLAEHIVVLLLAAITTTSAAPTNASLSVDAADVKSACGAYATVEDGAYDVQANQYYKDAQGSACAYAHGHNKEGIQWSSKWNFVAGPVQSPISAYPNVFLRNNKKAGVCKKVKNTNLINSYWKWRCV